MDAAYTAGFFNNAPTACGAAWGGTCGVDFSCSISLTGDSVGGCSQGETGCTSSEHSGAYPPATISGSINCSQTGDNGWCVGAASLSLSASEPLSDQSILLIEGTRNGEIFACPGSSCNVPLLEGQNDFTFWALSSWGDSSLMGNASAKVDSQPPQVSLNGPSSFCPDCGESLDVTLSVSDLTSGVSSWTLSLDGAALTGGSGSTSQTVSAPSAGLSAGPHTLSLTASDAAGNMNATSLTFSLLLPTPTPTFTPVPTNTPIPTSTPVGSGSQPGNPPAGQPAVQSGSSSPLVQGTPTNLTVTPAATATDKPGSALLAAPVVPSGQENEPASNESAPDGQQPSAPMPAALPPIVDNVIWGAAAAAAIGSATAYVLEQQKRRKEEEARARLEAERANAEARAREQAQREYQAALKAAEEARRQAPNPWADVDPETADMTEAEKLALYKQSPEYQAYQARMLEWEEQQSAQVKATQSTVLTSAPTRTPIPTLTPTVTSSYTPSKIPSQPLTLTPCTPEFTGTISLNVPSGLWPLDQFHQNQFDVRITGPVECVTTTIVTARNMINAILANKTSRTPLPDLRVQDYIDELDKMGWRSLPYRFPTDFPDIPIINFNPHGFMLPRSQAINALDRFAADLRQYYGCSFTVKQTSGNTIPDIAENLQEGNLVLISGMNEPLPNNLGHQILGGNPHTFGTVTDINFDAETITLIDTGESPTSTFPFQKFLEFWGRKSIYNRLYRK